MARIRTTRKTITKSSRFEVFKRDYFTCQYCGAQPPTVVLVIDHIHPVAAGGGNEMENLTTACEHCNQGKSDRLLSKIPIRPDADLMYLEAKQEAAELRRFREARSELANEQAEYCSFVQDEWIRNAGTDWAPADSLIMTALNRHGSDIAHRAIVATARRYAAGKVTETGWSAYIFGVAKSMESEDEN